MVVQQLYLQKLLHPPTPNACNAHAHTHHTQIHQTGEEEEEEKTFIVCKSLLPQKEERDSVYLCCGACCLMMMMMSSRHSSLQNPKQRDAQKRKKGKAI